MNYMDMLGRRSIILKRSINRLIMKKNRQGLSKQESSFYQGMLKKWHQNEHQLHDHKRNS